MTWISRYFLIGTYQSGRGGQRLCRTIDRRTPPHGRRCGLTASRIHSADKEHALAEIALNAGTVTQRICGFQMGTAGLTHLERDAQGPRASEMDSRRCLANALVKGMYGGTGQSRPSIRVRDEYRTADGRALISPSGLRPENVAEGIARCGLGVRRGRRSRSSQGIKDVDRSREDSFSRPAGLRPGIKAQPAEPRSLGARPRIRMDCVDGSTSSVQGYRLRSGPGRRLSDVTAPPYDVISPTSSASCTSSIPAM